MKPEVLDDSRKHQLEEDSAC